MVNENMINKFAGMIQRNLNFYGEDVELEKAIEELGELAEAIKTKKTEDVAEEIADVIIVCCQLARIYDVTTDEVVSIMDYKLTRQMIRIRQDRASTRRHGWT